jgi:hypothetical protein
MTVEIKRPRFWVAILAMVIGAVFILTDTSSEFGALLIGGAVAGYGITLAGSKPKPDQ